MARTTVKRPNGRYESIIDNDDAEQVAGRFEDMLEKYSVTENQIEEMLRRSINGK